MAKHGDRYPLLIYEHTLKRWYPKLFWLSPALFAFWWFLPVIVPDKGPTWADTILLYAAIGALVLGLFFLAAKDMAFVRPHPTHLQIVTPFLRFNISYKRIHQTATTEMKALFPPAKMSNALLENMAPLLVKTAIVINLKSYPVSPVILRLFLSPFFFKDKTPHIVILVDKWLSFSSEMESYRSSGGVVEEKKKSRNSVLSSLKFDE